MSDKFLSDICGCEFLAKRMQIKILSKQVLLQVALLGLVLFGVLFLYGIQKNSTNNNPVLPIEDVAISSIQEQSRVGLPVRLKIPNIHVDAPVEYVGLTSDGAMDVSESLDDVAWFDLGPRPGENGSSVIAGHYAGKNNSTSAVFDNIHKLRIGDKVFIEDDEGVVTAFVVRETRIYGKDEAAPEVFSSSDGKAHLNLVTCTGVWSEADKTFSHRLVVFTDKE